MATLNDFVREFVERKKSVSDLDGLGIELDLTDKFLPEFEKYSLFSPLTVVLNQLYLAAVFRGADKFVYQTDMNDLDYELAFLHNGNLFRTDVLDTPEPVEYLGSLNDRLAETSPNVPISGNDCSFLFVAEKLAKHYDGNLRLNLSKEEEYNMENKIYLPIKSQ